MTGVEVAAIRAKLGLTQEQFARELGCTSRSVGGWERGEHRPRGLSLVRLAEMERRAYATVGAAQRTGSQRPRP